VRGEREEDVQTKKREMANNLKQQNSRNSSSFYSRSWVHQMCIHPVPCVEPCILVSSVFDRLEGLALEYAWSKAGAPDLGQRTLYQTPIRQTASNSLRLVYPYGREDPPKKAEKDDRSVEGSPKVEAQCC
jgi:hypothetical protein